MQASDEVTTSAPRANGEAARMVGLDSLRGLAILAVVAFHVAIRFPPGGVVGKVAALGYNGVQLFFIVSAISMCFMWDQRRGERAPVRSFLVRRLCRIAPPFWFGIAFYMLWRQFGFMPEAPAGALDVLLTATFLHGFVPSAINLVVPGGWSIAVEVTFYALFPLLAMRIGDVRRRLVVGLVAYVCCTAVASAIRVANGASIDLFLYYCMLTQLPVFIVGMAVYSIAVRREPIPWARMAVVVVAWFVIAAALRSPEWLGRPGLWAEVAAMAVFSAIVIGRFESRVLAFAGRFSYSAYLFHFAVLDVLSLAAPARLHAGLVAFLAAGLLTCLGTGVIAWMSSKTLEAWSIAYGRTLVRRMNEARGELAKPAT